MSPLRGGASDKAGNVYEAYCGVGAMLRVLKGEVESMRIEVPGLDKSEFALKHFDGTKEHWQVKRNVSGQKDWSLQRLASNGILQAFLMNPEKSERLVFQSTSDAQDLRVLSELARGSQDFEEFEGFFLEQNSEHKLTFSNLCQVLKISLREKAYNFLRTVEVRTCDEKTAHSHAVTLLGVYYENPYAIFDILSQYYIEQIHQTLDRSKIKEHLKAKGAAERIGIYSPTLKESVSAVTEKFICSRKRNLIHQKLIRRKEGDDIVKALCESEKHLTYLVMSQAGGGKSALLHQLSGDLVEQGISVLAFSMDGISSASTARQIGEKLDLPDSPATTLCNASTKSPLVIVIDQVDYLSKISGRNNGLFEALYDLLDEIDDLRRCYNATIHLVLACRRFDYENDRSLKRRLQHSEIVRLGGLSEEEIQRVLDEDNFSLSSLKQPQIDLLKVPQNLRLFVESSASKVGNTRFQTQKDLFDIFWEEKRNVVDEGLDHFGDEWVKAIRIMCEQMSKSQKLVVPVESLDSVNRKYLNRMASEGVLVRQEEYFSFQHESFFDYCYARMIVGENVCFISILEQDEEQDLFRRTQLRQYLTYLRERQSGFSDYLDKMKELIHRKEIRFHLKQLAIQLIGEWNDPKKEEWELIFPFIQAHIAKGIKETDLNLNGLERTSFFTMFSPSLFSLPEVERFVRQLLASKDPDKERVAIRFLMFQAEYTPEKAIGFLEPHASEVGHWPESLAWFCYGVRSFSEKPCLFDFYMRLLDKGYFDSIIFSREKDHSDITYLINHEQFIRYFEGRLKRYLANAVNIDGKYIRSPLDGGHSFSLLIKAAEAMPEFFLERILPLVFLLGNAYKAKTKREHADIEFHDDHFWHPIGYGLEFTTIFNGQEQDSDSSHRIVYDNEGVIKSIQKALILLGKKSVDNLLPFIQELKSQHLYVANFILVNLYVKFKEHFGEEAMQLCAKEPGRVFCGNMQNAYSCGGELLRLCSPLCTDETFDKLERNLLDYYDIEDERHGEDHDNSRRVIFYLDTSRTKDSTKKLSEEWENQFQRRAESRQRQHSPIEDAMFFGRAIDLTDDEYYETASKHDDPREGEKHDFRLLLKNNVTDTNRLVSLAINAPENTSPLLFSSVFFAFYDKTISLDDAFALIRKIAPLQNSKLNHDAIFFLNRQKIDQLPDDIIEFVFCTSIHGISSEELPDKEEKDFLTHGINTPRGAAICCLGKLLGHDPSIAQRFTRQIKSIIEIESLSVSCCVPAILGHLLNIDRDYWIGTVDNYYLRLDERAFATSWNKQLFREVLVRYPASYLPFIDRLLKSKYSYVRKQGAKHALTARRYIDDPIDILTITQAGDRYVQLGIAESVRKFVHNLECLEWIQPLLRHLFNSEDENVRKAASFSLSNVQENCDVELYRKMILDFIASPSFLENMEHLWEFQKKFTFFPPDLTLHLCKSYLNAVIKSADDNHRKHWIANKVGRMAFRAYSSSSSREKMELLDIIDEMMNTGLFGAGEHIESYERD